MSLKPAFIGIFTCFALSSFSVFAQEVRPRRVVEIQPQTQTTVLQRPVNAVRIPSANKNQTVTEQRRDPSRSVLTNDILVQQTAKTTVAASKTASANALAAFRTRLSSAMSSKIGLPYRYGSEGPNSYDCSALVQTVFGAAGMYFERTSARNYWNSFEPATEAEKTQFGTLIFFNRLGHVGIVVDENTFYHASSSKGVTYSKLEGYWSKRVVGYRRIPLNQSVHSSNF